MLARWLRKTGHCNRAGSRVFSLTVPIASNPQRKRCHRLSASVVPASAVTDFWSGLIFLSWLVIGTVACGAAEVPTTPVAVSPAAAVSKAPAPTTRRLEEQELRDLLTQTLNQKTGIGAEWELRFTRPWTPINVVDEPLSLEIIEPALNRITTSCLLRVELRAGRSVVGSYQLPLQARLWREVLVARAALQRGQSLADAPLDPERRDVLSLRQPMVELPSDAYAYELSQTVAVGMPLTATAVRLRPVVYRGQLADAVVHNGSMMISLKVEVLEEGAPGQVVRVRNPQSRRELRGKVQDERTIAILL